MLPQIENMTGDVNDVITWVLCYISKSRSTEVNFIVQREFELAIFESAVEHFSYYATMINH